MRVLWLALTQRLGAYDELAMATTRLRFMTSLEVTLGNVVPFAIHPFEANENLAVFESEKAVAKATLRKCVGQVLYLQNLEKMGLDINEEPCPVCRQALGREWGVFTCGHPLCMECTIVLVKRQPRPLVRREVVRVKCPLCREYSLSSEINYVQNRGEEEMAVQVKGSHSTKIAAIVRTLLMINRGNPTAKSLVFSTWLQVLDLIAKALNENGIKYHLLNQKKTFQPRLTAFKSSAEVTVLLLPFPSGSKGLNIVEATHVLLAEPLLNMAAEQQAIGRVHRMGQTQVTTVHRYYIRDTVEERIHSLLSSQPAKAELCSSNEKESGLNIAELKALLQ